MHKIVYFCLKEKKITISSLKNNFCCKWSKIVRCSSDEFVAWRSNTCIIIILPPFVLAVQWTLLIQWYQILMMEDNCVCVCGACVPGIKSMILSLFTVLSKCWGYKVEETYWTNKWLLSIPLYYILLWLQRNQFSSNLLKGKVECHGSENQLPRAHYRQPSISLVTQILITEGILAVSKLPGSEWLLYIPLEWFLLLSLSVSPGANPPALRGSTC